MKLLENRVVMITGALGNLGATTAEAMLAAGARLVLLDRSRDKLFDRFGFLEADHLLIDSVDVTDAQAVEETVATVIERFGRIDGLFNTVGAFRGGTAVVDTSPDDFELLFRINVRTTFVVCRAVVAEMRRVGRGRIINTASRDAWLGEAGTAAYSASKAGVLRLTESLAREVVDSEITVNAVVLGTLDTPQNRAAFPEADHSRWIAPAAVADVVVFLCSEGARAVHGAAIPISGRQL